MRRILNFSTADLHEECQSALSIASASNSEGAIPQRFNVDLCYINTLAAKLLFHNSFSHSFIHQRTDLGGIMSK